MEIEHNNLKGFAKFTKKGKFSWNCWNVCGRIIDELCGFEEVMLLESREKSNSIEQQMAEQIIFEKVKHWLKKDLKENSKIPVGNTYMQPDFYSKEDGIVGEIFAHIGKPRKGQNNKIANDILKMLLLEKLENRIYKKIIVVCDEEERKKLTGASVLAECIRQFDIEVKMIDIDMNLRNVLIAAQKRQRMINA